MSPRVTLETLVQDNPFAMMGVVTGLLKSVDREMGTRLSAEYRDKALTAGSHEELVRISFKYALYVADSLQVTDDVERYVAIAAGEVYEDKNSEQVIATPLRISRTKRAVDFALHKLKVKLGLRERDRPGSNTGPDPTDASYDRMPDDFRVELEDGSVMTKRDFLEMDGK